MKTCTSCKKDKTLSSFNKNQAKNDGLQNVCRQCNKANAKRYYKKNKEQIKKSIYKNKKQRMLANKKRLMAFLRKHSCVDCGYKNPLALDFDHVRGNKKAEVTKLLKEGYSWEIIQEEINKCEVRCRNCHSIKTHKEQGSYRVKV